MFVPKGIFPETMLLAMDPKLRETFEGRKILVIGAGGFIARSLLDRLGKFNCAVIYVSDVDENRLVDSVRRLHELRIQSKVDYEVKSSGFDWSNRILVKRFIEDEIIDFDYIFNFAAVKHVRAERDFFSLAQLVHSNILVTTSLLSAFEGKSLPSYFFMSTDKAADPVNCMGASKKIMETITFSNWPNSLACRFANVAYSYGSLLESFIYRFDRSVPLAIPASVKRFFISREDAANIILLSLTEGSRRAVFFPEESIVSEYTFENVVSEHLASYGLMPKFIDSSQDVGSIVEYTKCGYYPVLVATSLTDGEKNAEVFCDNVGSVENSMIKGLKKIYSTEDYLDFHAIESDFRSYLNSNNSSREGIIRLLGKYCNEFLHLTTGSSLDRRY